MANTFARCRSEGRSALIGYLTAFDPDRAGSLERLAAACESGLDVLELGVPFSDPTADGPAVQAAMVRALQSGASLRGVLSMAEALRQTVDVPIVLFSYANPLLRWKPDELVAALQRAGIDAVLVVDMPPERAHELREPLRTAGIDWIGLVAPTSTAARIHRVAEATTGFLYVVSLKGVTGSELADENPDLDRVLQQVRSQTDVPVAVGFGIRTPDQVRRMAAKAEGVVVGSALVRAAEEGVEPLRQLIRALRGAT